MPNKTKTTVIEKEVEVDKDDSPGVVAYRVGQLEKNQSEGFKQLNDKIDSYMNSFASKEEVRELELKVEKLESRTENYPLVRTLVFSCVGIILVTVIGALVALVVR